MNNISYPPISVSPTVDQFIAESIKAQTKMSDTIQRNCLLDELSNLNMKDLVNPKNLSVKNLAIGPKAQTKITAKYYERPAQQPCYERPAPPKYYESPDQQPCYERPAPPKYYERPDQQPCYERPAPPNYYEDFVQCTKQYPNPRGAW
jgi:hypothetical protein